MDMICNISSSRPSASDLVQDLLIANGEALQVKALCRAGTLFGLSESAIRVALNRLVKQGKISHGARGYYSLKIWGQALSRAVDDWQHKGAQREVWNRRWLAVQDGGVTRSDKTIWRHHCLALSLRGFRMLKPGLQIRPDNLIGGINLVRRQLLELGLAPEAIVFQLTELDDASQAKALGLWQAKKLSAQYQQMIDALESSSKGFKNAALEQALRESLLLGRAVIIQLIRDPLLPQEMTPSSTRLNLIKGMEIYQRKARILWRQWLA